MSGYRERRKEEMDVARREKINPKIFDKKIDFLGI